MNTTQEAIKSGLHDVFGGVGIHRPPLQKKSHCEAHGDFTSLCHVGHAWTKCSACRKEQDAKEAQEQKARDEAEALHRWQLRVEGAGIPERFRDRRFKSFVAETDDQKAVLALLTDYARDWPEMAKTGRSLVLTGHIGTGKNHLACAIGMHVMHKHRASVLFVTMAQLVRRVQDTYAKGSTKSASKAIAELVEPALLIVDEVGLQAGTDYERNLFFDVMNERYLKRRPTIMMSNMTDEEIKGFVGERVIDRLREDGGMVVPFTWESHRSRMGENH